MIIQWLYGVFFFSFLSAVVLCLDCYGSASAPDQRHSSVVQRVTMGEHAD